MNIFEASLSPDGDLEDFSGETVSQFDNPLEYDLHELLQQWIDGDERLPPFSGSYVLADWYSLFMQGSMTGAADFDKHQRILAQNIHNLAAIDDTLGAWFVKMLYLQYKENGLTKEQVLKVVNATFVGADKTRLRDVLRHEAAEYYEE